MQADTSVALDSGVIKHLLGTRHVYVGPQFMVALKLSRSVTTPFLAGTKKRTKAQILSLSRVSPIWEMSIWAMCKRVQMVC
jgi:hypothetical protein